MTRSWDVVCLHASGLSRFGSSIAEYWHDRAREVEEKAERTDYLERARTHYIKAWKLNDSMPETYAMYGHTFLMEDQRFDKAIEVLEEAEYLLPSDLGIRMSLAETYAGADRREDAVKAARSVLAWSHEDSDAAQRARAIVDIFEHGE